MQNQWKKTAGSLMYLLILWYDSHSTCEDLVGRVSMAYWELHYN